LAIRTELHDGNQLEVVGDDFAEVVRVFSPHLSRDGVFVETDLWVADGTPVRFRLGLADGFPLVHAMGVVAWRRSAASDPTGIAIRFEHVVEGTALIERIVDQHQLEGGAPFRLEGLPGPRPTGASGRGSSTQRTIEPDEVAERGAGLEILETLDRGAAPRLAPGLERVGDVDLQPKARLSRELSEALGVGAESAPPEETAPPEEASDPVLEQSVSELRSLLGGAKARPDLLTKIVTEPPARTYDQLVRRRSSGTEDAGGERASRRPATRSAGSVEEPRPLPGSGEARFAEGAERTPWERPARAAGAAPASSTPGEARPGRPGAEAGRPADRPSGEVLHVDLDALGGTDSPRAEANPRPESERPEAADPPSEAPATDPLISASWLLERWENIAGEKSGPPSEDPALARPVEPARPRAAARARGAGGFPLVPVLVLGVVLVAAYLAAQRWYFDRPRAGVDSLEPAAGELDPSTETTELAPELRDAAPGRSLSEILAGARSGDPAVEVADGALTGAPAGVLERVTWDTAAGETRILIEGDGAFLPEAIRHVRLAGEPPRELLRVSGILRPLEPPRYEVESPEVRSLRFGFHEQGGAREAHVVIDLAAPGAGLRVVRLAPERMVLVISGRRR
jgi:hypothetical protein